jgi:cellulose synthase/poly-beta-1,6-N-acetylglucosamine synthase-like glycosyltransferase
MDANSVVRDWPAVVPPPSPRSPQDDGAWLRDLTLVKPRGVYDGATEIAGPLTEPDGRVGFRDVLSRRQKVTATLLIALNVAAAAGFVGWLAEPAHLPAARFGGHPAAVAGAAAFGLLVLLELIRLVQGATLWVFTMRAKDPVPVAAPPGLRVAVLTTIVPGKEPLDLVVRTLAAMRRIRYSGQVDVWILDEGDDVEVRRAAARLGVRHFSRKGRPEYNQPSGEFKARTKAGNHNAWRAEHEHSYDVVAQMDPDHVPHPEFLERTLGYFTDPDVAFVVAPQVYGNLHEGFVQHAAATQAYFFHGVIQRGGNGMHAPLLIGTNHLYRTGAWRQIGGYQDSVIEDHLTAMRVYAAVNTATGNRYRGVYTPDILSVGEGPGSWTDFFNQQKRWAYGIWEILLRHTPRVFPRLAGRQRLAFGLLQIFYPSVAVVWLLGTLLTLSSVTTGVATVSVPGRTWLALWAFSMASSVSLFLWLRRFNLVEHERREWGIAGMAMLAATIPVYAAAAFTALARRPLAYAVTAKGNLSSPDRLRTFRAHLAWAGLAIGGIGTALAMHRDAPAILSWLSVTSAVTLAPAAGHLVSRLRRRGAGAGAAVGS